MARRIISITTITPTSGGVADSTAMASAGYPWIIQGGSTTQLIKIWEISISGQASSSSSPTFMIQSRDSTVANTNSYGTGQMDAAMDPFTAALSAAPLTGNTNTTAPQRSSSLHLQNCSLNAFGGVFFWRANRLEECSSVFGNTASFGEQSLSAFTGGTVGAIGAHCIYEPI